MDKELTYLIRQPGSKNAILNVDLRTKITFFQHNILSQIIDDKSNKYAMSILLNKAIIDVSTDLLSKYASIESVFEVKPALKNSSPKYVGSKIIIKGEPFTHSERKICLRYMNFYLTRRILINNSSARSVFPEHLCFTKIAKMHVNNYHFNEPEIEIAKCLLVLSTPENIISMISNVCNQPHIVHTVDEILTLLLASILSFYED